MCNESVVGTNRCIFFDGACYVSPPNLATYADARLSCNHIQGAAVARLAWIKTNAVLDKLKYMLISQYPQVCYHAILQYIDTVRVFLRCAKQLTEKIIANLSEPSYFQGTVSLHFAML